jgi:adenylate kinase
LIRAELKKDNEWSKKAKSFVDSGKLVPEDMTNPLLDNKMNSYIVKNNGYVLDGYPR